MPSGSSGTHDYLLQFFEYTHLPVHEQLICEPFHSLAHDIMNNIASNPERTMALRKLLESKDCAVRAILFHREIVSQLDVAQ